MSAVKLRDKARETDPDARGRMRPAERMPAYEAMEDDRRYSRVIPAVTLPT